MATPQPLPVPEHEQAGDTGTPNQYRLRGNGVRISYFPDGAGPLTGDGPIIVVYQDTHRSLTFRGMQVGIVHIAGLGTCVSVTLETGVDAESTTATLLIPTVVLPAGQSARIQTQLITTVHAPTLNGVGHPQRDHYTVTPLIGEARQGALPL